MIRTVTISLLAALASVPNAAAAQSYKCIWQDGTVTHQDTPCRPPPPPPGHKEVQVYQPSSDDVQQARERAARDRARMQAIELDRDADRASADRQRQADDLRRQGEVERCARLERDIRDTKKSKDLWSSPAIRQREESRLADMEREHFRKCFGRN